MPQEPKKKHSKGRKRTRRASIKLSGPIFIKCPNCGQEMLFHQACPSCGFYKGKQVIKKMKIKVTKA